MSPIDARFTPVSLAGHGAFGTVYRALDVTTSREVALKILDRARTDFARFEREAEVLATVRHPNVVRYVAHGLTDQGAPYLAMEWLAGEDLGKALSRRSVFPREALAVATGAARGLGAAHALGIIHRDVKPSNLFLVGRSVDDVRVIDFGIARAPRSMLTSEHTVLGTPEYMAPEQAQGLPLAPSADVFALGCVLFECLVGESPFAAPDAASALMKILRCVPPRLREIRPGIPRSVDELVARLLARDPEARPRDGDAAAAILAEVLGELA